MAKIIFTMPDDVAVNVTEAFCNMYGYQPSTTDGNGEVVPNPQTAAEFAQQQVVSFVRKTVIEYLTQQRIEQVKSQTIEEIEAIEVVVEAV